MFLKKESDWDEEKCKLVAKKFIIEYSNKWETLKGDWHSKARKWILTEFQKEKGSAQKEKGSFPDYYDKSYAAKILSTKELQAYGNIAAD